MEKHNLNEMVGGWFIGDFEPSVINTSDFEVSVKRYLAGQSEERHLHKVATEVTTVISGEIEMNKVKFSAGDIVTIHPGESTDFLSLTDSTTVVVKTPSVLGDKYF